MYIWMFFMLTYNNIQVILIWIKFLNLFFTELILRYPNVGFVGFSMRRFSNSWEKSWEYERWILLIPFPIVCYVRSFPIVLYVHSLYCLSFSMFWVWAPSPITPSLSLLSLFYSVKLFYMLFFLSFILSHSPHRYLYNYFATTFSHFLFYFSFKIYRANIQFPQIWHMYRYCKNCYSSNIDTFLKNIQWVAEISHKFLIITNIIVIHNRQEKRR